MLLRYNESNLEQSNCYLLVSIYETWRRYILSSNWDFFKAICALQSRVLPNCNTHKLKDCCAWRFKKVWLKISIFQLLTLFWINWLEQFKAFCITVCATLSAGKIGLFLLSSIQRVNICLILHWIKTSACSHGSARDGLPVADTLPWKSEFNL